MAAKKVSKKKTVKKQVEQEPKSRIYNQPDAQIIINVFTPDYEPKEYRFQVKNIRGSTFQNQRSPDNIISSMMSGLRSKYGNKIK